MGLDCLGWRLTCDGDGCYRVGREFADELDAQHFAFKDKWIQGTRGLWYCPWCSKKRKPKKKGST